MKRTSTAITLGLVAVQGTYATTAFANPSWDLLRSVQVEEIIGDNSYEVRKIFPSAIENGVEQFDISGYVVGIWQEGEIEEFILISDMGFCPFCGDPEHGTALPVTLSAGVTDLIEGQRVTLRGALEAVTDPETTQAARLVDAQLLR